MELNTIYAITLLLFIYPLTSFSLENSGFRVELNHVDSQSNFTQLELLTRTATRTMHRLSRLTGMQLFSSANITIPVQSGNTENTIGEYYMNLAIGNPPLYYSAVVDTGSDLIWTQCRPCKKCTVSTTTPIYDPSSSTTVSTIPCNSGLYKYLCTVTSYPPPACLCSYNYTYGSGWTSGTLKQETFLFGRTKPVQVSSPVFGCSTSSSDDFDGTSGLVGFSRGPLSLPSQLNTSMFSYCLTSFFDVNSTSTLIIGPSAKFSGTAIKSTSFVQSPSQVPLNTFYYLSLQGISLGTTKLAIQPSVFSLQSDGTGGLIIDSGTTFTHLINQAFQVVTGAIDSIVNLPRVDGSKLGFYLCYSLPSSSSQPKMPDMTLHFRGADMVLPVENYMVEFVDNNNNIFWCLAMSPTEGFSVLGNYQQQNFHILYDVAQEVLSFYPTQCNTI